MLDRRFELLGVLCSGFFLHFLVPTDGAAN
jgi:hypothetical protein